MTRGRNLPNRLAGLWLQIRSRFGSGRAVALVWNSVLYDERFYARQAGVRQGLAAVEHFVTTGGPGGLAPSRFFDASFYLEAYPDVSRHGLNPLVHYLMSGWKEGRRGNPRFDADAYRTDHADVDFSSVDPLSHCVATYGGIEWARDSLPASATASRADVSRYVGLVEKSGFFDHAYYLSMYPDVAAAQVDPLRHYLATGWREHRNPSSEFDTLYYIRSAGLPVGARAVCPLVAFIRSGAPLAQARPPGALTLRTDGTPPSEDSSSLRIAVHVHAFYPDLIEEVLPALRNIPQPYRLVFTVCREADRAFCESVLERRGLENFQVLTVENRGRDVAPMLECARLLAGRYDAMLHLHTKRSPHSNFGDDWRHYLYDQLLGSPELVRQALAVLSSPKECGVLYPENFFRIKRFVDWGGNVPRIRELILRLGLPAPAMPAIAEFAAGSMAWYRADVLDLVAWHVCTQDFEPERGQVDLTLAHVLERAFPLIAGLLGKPARVYHCTGRSRLEPAAELRGPAGRPTDLCGDR